MYDDNTLTKLRLGVCVVTHKEAFCETRAFLSLSSLPNHIKERLLIVSVFNAAPKNTSLGLHNYDKNPNLKYHERVFAENLGLSGGYNSCIKIIGSSDITAILFLNADSNVTEDYLECLILNLGNTEYDIALVPRLRSCNNIVSPFSKPGFNYPFFIIGFLCLKRGSFLDNLIFPDDFWLDGIDYWLSSEIHRANVDVKFLDLDLEHDLSVSNQFKTLSLWRYKNILVTERLFYHQEGVKIIYLYYLYFRAVLKCIASFRWDLFVQVLKEFRVVLRNE